MKKKLISIVFLLILSLSVVGMAESHTRTMTVSRKQMKKEGVKIPSKKLYTYENVLLLAKLLMAENGHAKHDETVWLTGVVVLKRVQAKAYPNTVAGVIYQRGQYSTARSLSRVKPSTRCMEIAEELLIYGVKDYPKNLVFQSMFPQGKKVYKCIDGEYFCLA